MSKRHAWCWIVVGAFLCCSIVARAEGPLNGNPARWHDEFRSLGDWWRYQSVLGTTNDGKQLLIGSNGKHLVFYDLTEGRVARKLATREGMQSATLSPDGNLLAVAEWRDGFTLRNAHTFDVLKTFSGSEGLGAWSVRFSDDGKRLLCYSRWFNSSNRSSQIQFFMYDIKADREVELQGYRLYDAPTSYVRERFGRNGTHVLSVQRTRDRGRITGYGIWVTDPFSGENTPAIKLNDRDFHQFDLSPDGRRVIVQQPGEPIRVIDARSGETLTTLRGRNWATGAAFSPDGRLIASVRGSKFLGLVATDKRPAARVTNMTIHDATTGEELARLEHPDVHRDYYQVGFSRNGQYVFSITAEKKSRREVVLWGKLPKIPAQIDPLPTFEDAKTPPPTPNRAPITLQPRGVGARNQR